MLVIGDFQQFSSSGWMIFEHLMPIDAWLLSKLHELTEIVRQNNDPEFVELLNRVLVGVPTQSDIAGIYAMADTDISDCPENHFRLYVTNHLVGKRNMEMIACIQCIIRFFIYVSLEYINIMDLIMHN